MPNGAELVKPLNTEEPSSTLIPSEDIDNFETLKTFVENGSCVLLLGPLFGIDADGNKIHSKLKDLLTSDRYKFSLDSEFDNLYILRKSDGLNNARIKSVITNFYKNIARNEIYDKLLDIGFSGIISFTSDLLLSKANATKNAYDFYAFNGRQLVVAEDESQGISEKPVIFNVFGDMNDLNALIVDYDSLYEFLMSIIKAETQIPLQLRETLKQASSFLLLGFDLSKWYIPIIIRKLNQFILANQRKTPIDGFVCLDDSTAPPREGFEESLSKYPLFFSEFKILGSIELISHLHQFISIKREKESLNTGQASAIILNGTHIQIFKEWAEASIHTDKESALKDFFQLYKQINYTGLYKKDFKGQSMEYYQVRSLKLQGKITRESYEVRLTEIIDALHDIITQFTGPIE
ncbi:SIR2 family protein [Flavisolibacter tropicus]|uniref:SIR2-like domain-containing protein n=1 Tax=Flavisolibacter tropicus TaxID=1492898 RepID=A0A172TV57_9BACT|nr:SIR2 family protein [Flavisolibacter tropicus]ANE50617.1 hypothetical protein SY85_08995 [Flavisolibacter tropicus]